MGPPAPSPVSGPEAQHAVQELLRRAEYHRDDPGFLDRAWSWVLDRLDDLLRGTPGGDLTLVLLVLLGAVVVFALVKAGPLGRTKVRAEDPLRPAAAVDHRARAVAFESDGRYAEALREWLRAAVRVIEDREVLAPRPGRTGRSTAREAAPLLPDAAQPLTRASEIFDDVWFGGRRATAADAAAGRAAADAVGSARMARATLTSDTGFTVPR